MRTLDTLEVIGYHVPHINPIKILQSLKEGEASTPSHKEETDLEKKVHGSAGSHSCLVTEENLTPAV